MVYLLSQYSDLIVPLDNYLCITGSKLDRKESYRIISSGKELAVYNTRDDCKKILRFMCEVLKTGQRTFQFPSQEMCDSL